MIAPDWIEPDAAARWLRLADSRTVITWERIVSAAVWLAREDSIYADGRSVAGPTTIHVGEPQDGLTLTEAAELAADLLTATELAESSLMYGTRRNVSCHEFSDRFALCVLGDVACPSQCRASTPSVRTQCRLAVDRYAQRGSRHCR